MKNFYYLWFSKAESFLSPSKISYALHSNLTMWMISNEMGISIWFSTRGIFFFGGGEGIEVHQGMACEGIRAYGILGAPPPDPEKFSKNIKKSMEKCNFLIILMEILFRKHLKFYRIFQRKFGQKFIKL